MYRQKNKPTLLLDDETLTFVRPSTAPVTVVDGLRVRAGASQLTFKCTGNVQPLGGRDLELAPEGQREAGGLSMWIWHDDAELPPCLGDVVLRDGQYLVMSAEDWGAYMKLRLARDDAEVIANG